MRGVLVIIGLCMLAACSQTARVRGPATHKVVKSETLYSIAWRYQLNYHDLSRWNSIPSPYTIYPGQRIVLQAPRGEVAQKQESTSLLRLPGQPRDQQGAGQAAQQTMAPDPAPQANAKSQPKPAAAPVKSPPVPPRGAWLWPTDGKIVKQFDSRQKRSLGVDIAGGEGQSIRAAAGGRVVYSGSGIPSYGRLVIVKHDAAFLSAYAHNRKLLVSEGAQVRAGQLIAEMGRDDDNRQILHFEIRKNGKPVNPLHYLKK
ncbi:MAG: peptidoglycan DD-metalloendopeptidase family protein [Gammaproteobacteria bacterium]|nr:peptidoglycan DD-metalloendopeptidase family protein [Gammaproteobacteria bacterium]